jgi:hypothetical protein
MIRKTLSSLLVAAMLAIVLVAAPTTQQPAEAHVHRSCATHTYRDGHHWIIPQSGHYVWDQGRWRLVYVHIHQNIWTGSRHTRGTFCS